MNISNLVLSVWSILSFKKYLSHNLIMTPAYSVGVNYISLSINNDCYLENNSWYTAAKSWSILNKDNNYFINSYFDSSTLLFSLND